MQTESAKIAEKFISGSLTPILEKMLEEVPEHGIQENRKVSRTDLASYFIGKVLARFEPQGTQSYGWLDNFIFRENPKKSPKLGASLIKPAFAEAMLDRPEERHIYSELLMLPDDEINEPLMWSGLFSEQILMERERIGERIKQLRLEHGLSQEQLAEKVGMLKQNISRIETGRYSTGQDILSKIGKVFGKNLDFI